MSPQAVAWPVAAVVTMGDGAHAAAMGRDVRRRAVPALSVVVLLVLWWLRRRAVASGRG